MSEILDRAIEALDKRDEKPAEFFPCACGVLYPHTQFATECRDCTRLRRIVAEVISDHPAIRHIAGKP